jgi:hypothetical protein
MFLAIKNGFVVERSDNEDSLLTLDQVTHEIVEWNGPTPSYDPENGLPMLDPRDASQKDKDAKERYLQWRRKVMPSIDEILAMIYRDMKRGTTEYVDAIDAIHARFPKPTKAER